MTPITWDGPGIETIPARPYYLHDITAPVTINPPGPATDLGPLTGRITDVEQAVGDLRATADSHSDALGDLTTTTSAALTQLADALTTTSDAITTFGDALTHIEEAAEHLAVITEPALGIVPPGWWIHPQQVNAASDGPLTPGRVYWHPALLPPGTYTRLSITVGTAQAGGDARLLAGIYPTRADQYAVPTTQPPIATAEWPGAQLETTGSKIATLTAPVTLLVPTWIWIGQLYHAPVTPATALRVSRVFGLAQSLLGSAGAGASTMIRGYYREDQTALPGTPGGIDTEQPWGWFRPSGGPEFANITLGTSP